MTYMSKLDGLRGVAVILVLFQHFPAVEDAAWFNSVLFLFKKLGLGYVGVEVFFLLSGFLITSLLLQSVERGDSHILSDFYIKRAFRILPIFFITIVVCVILMPDYDYRYVAAFLANYFFAFNPESHPLRHFWSLAVEEQYYLLWPMLVLFACRRRVSLSYILVILCVLAVFVILYRDIVVSTGVARALIHRSVETRMLALCVGGLLAVHGVPRIKIHTLIISAFVIVLAVLLMQEVSKLGWWPYMKSVKALGFLGLSLTLFLMAYNQSSFLAGLFKSKPIVGIGKISYGLYVYHLPLFYYFGYSHMQIKGEFVSYSVALALAVGTGLVALTSWFFLERPLIRYRERFLGYSALKNPATKP